MLGRIRMLAVQSAAVVTALLGVGGLAAFCWFLWTASPGLVSLHMTSSGALVWDAMLCLLFFVQHSGMIRRPFRLWLRRLLPDCSHGLIYTIASALGLLLLVVFWQPVDGYYLQGVWLWMSRAVLGACLAGVVWAFASLGNFDAFGTEAFIAACRNERDHRPVLAVKGPYRLVRHPFYALGIVAVWAGPVWSSDRLLFNVLFTIWICWGSRLEERDLVEDFGEEYRSYQRSVPMLLPHIRLRH